MATDYTFESPEVHALSTTNIWKKKAKMASGIWKALHAIQAMAVSVDKITEAQIQIIKGHFLQTKCMVNETLKTLLN